MLTGSSPEVQSTYHICKSGFTLCNYHSVIPRFVLCVPVPPSEIEFNLTGSYGSPIHTNHNSNYIPMPSPDMDQSEHKQQHDQSRRPLSVATDNMMLEFYKKDGYGAKCNLLLPTSLSFSLSPAAHASSPASDSCSYI